MQRTTYYVPEAAVFEIFCLLSVTAAAGQFFSCSEIIFFLDIWLIFCILYLIFMEILLMQPDLDETQCNKFLWKESCNASLYMMHKAM